MKIQPLTPEYYAAMRQSIEAYDGFNSVKKDYFIEIVNRCEVMEIDLPDALLLFLGDPSASPNEFGGLQSLVTQTNYHV